MGCLYFYKLFQIIRKVIGRRPLTEDPTSPANDQKGFESMGYSEAIWFKVGFSNLIFTAIVEPVFWAAPFPSHRHDHRDHHDHPCASLSLAGRGDMNDPFGAYYPVGPYRFWSGGGIELDPHRRRGGNRRNLQTAESLLQGVRNEYWRGLLPSMVLKIDSNLLTHCW